MASMSKSPTPSSDDKASRRAAALKHWRLTLEVNQAGPLLEQMAQQWSIGIDKGTFSGYVVCWRGAYGHGDSMLEAALECVEEKYFEVTK